MARSLNRVQLIGNLTRDPELRYTPNGTAVCSFGLATNRSWTTDTGEKHEEAEFHRIVSWNKLAELCSRFLTKGRKVYVEGRLATRNWTAQDGTQRTSTEIVIDNMILLDSRRPGEETAGAELEPTSPPVSAAAPSDDQSKNPPAARAGKKGKKAKGGEETAQEEQTDESVSPDDVPDDIPF